MRKILLLLLTLAQIVCSISFSISESLQSPPESQSYSFQKDYDAIEQKAKSIFYVDIFDKDAKRIGNASGFVAFQECLFVTNQHVIDGATFLRIWDEDDHSYILDQVAISDKKI